MINKPSIQDLASRALREERAAEAAVSPEARLAHRTMAKMCREQVAQQNAVRESLQKALG